MFNETAYNFDGLGDAQCLAQVQSYPSSYVFKGAHATYTFSGRYGGFPFSQYFRNATAEIQNAVAARGYSGVSVSISGAAIGDGAGSVSFQIPVDQSNANDVRANVRSAISGLGINVSSDNISINNPTFTQICGSGGAGAPPSNTGSVGTAPPAGSIGSFLDNFASGIGISTPIVLAIGAGALLLLLKK